MLGPLLKGIAVDYNVLSIVDLMERTLLSQPNLEKVVRMADLDASGEGTEDLIADLRRRISITGEGQSLFTIAYTAPHQSVGLKVIQSLINVFVESNLGNSRQDMQSARTFIDQQLNVYASQLDEAEKQMSDFKAKNVGFLPGDNNYVSKLDASKGELEKTQAELAETQQKREELQKQIASVPKVVDTVSAGPGPFGSGPFGSGPMAGGPIPGGASGVATNPAARVNEIQNKIDQLLLNYTDQYPDVVRLKRQLEIAKADEKKAEDAAKSQGDAQTSSPNSTTFHSTGPNPVYQQLQLQLVQLDTTIASLQSRVQRDQAEVVKWQSLAAAVPQAAAQMAKLNRNYDVIKKSYDELLNRREAAKIGNDMQTETQAIQYRIIDPPHTSPIPVAPNRALLISAVFVAAIGSGVGFAFFLSRIDDAITDFAELSALFEVPVLGVVTLFTLPAARRRMRVQAAGFAVTCAVLMIAYAGIMSAILLTQPHA